MIGSQKVLVTGGAGFIGAHTVVELLREGIEPVIVDDLSRSSELLLKGIEKITGQKLIFYKINCLDKDKLRGVFQQHPDIKKVIHFAAYKSVNESVKHPLMYYQNNIGTLMTLLETMEEFKIGHLVFSSSCTVYGQPDKIPVTEETPFKEAESPYGATKQMCERILQDQVKASSYLNVISLRYFNPIGAHPTGLIGELPIGVPTNLVPYITQTAIGKIKQLTIFGSDYNTPDGSCLRDFIHIVDLAAAHVKALQKIDSPANRYEALNVGSGVPVSVLELVKTFIRVTGVQVNYLIGPRREGDVEKIYADPARSLAVLDWKTHQTIETALVDAWNWQQKLK